MKFLWIVRAALALLVLVGSKFAFADTPPSKVAVLSFSSVGNATSARLDAARDATRSAVIQSGHRLPTDSEMLTAQMASKDGVADTSGEYRAAGRASGSAWTIAGRVEDHGTSYRLELEVCQVESGRVESLAREVDPAQAPAQIGEMLALLLRPEGIANAEIPWERTPTTVAPPPKPVEPAPPPTPAGPPPAPAQRHAYAEGRPFALGVGMSVLGALSRPSNARGPSTAALIDGVGAYAIESVPGLEARVHGAGAIVGPSSFSIDGGARYAFPVAPTLRVFAGPELAVGAFFPLGGDRSGRFLARGAAFAAIGIGDRVQVEVSGDLAVAPGSSGTLLFGGATLRGLARF